MSQELDSPEVVEILKSYSNNDPNEEIERFKNGNYYKWCNTIEYEPINEKKYAKSEKIAKQKQFWNSRTLKKI